MGDKGKVIIVGTPRPNEICELCGKEGELRPYGPGGKRVCYECAMKDPEEAERQFNRRVEEGGDTVIL